MKQVTNSFSVVRGTFGRLCATALIGVIAAMLLSGAVQASILHPDECQNSWGSVPGAVSPERKLPDTLSQRPELPITLQFTANFAIPSPPSVCPPDPSYIHSEIEAIALTVNYSNLLSGPARDTLSIQNLSPELNASLPILVSGTTRTFGIEDFTDAPLITTAPTEYAIEGSLLPTNFGRSGAVRITSITASVSGSHHYVPEPSGLALLGLGLVFLLIRAHRSGLR